VSSIFLGHISRAVELIVVLCRFKAIAGLIKETSATTKETLGALLSKI